MIIGGLLDDYADHDTAQLNIPDIAQEPANHRPW
jgi:hypothetical protein